MLALAARTQLDRAHDPVPRLRRRLAISSDALATLEQEVSLAVATAVGKALGPAAAAGEEVRS